MGSKNNFYRDIDRQEKKRHCCTCQTMMIGFAVLFVVGALGIGWLFKALTASDLAPVRLVTPSQKALEAYQDKISQKTAEALLKRQAGGNEKVSLTITEEELTSAIASQADALSEGSVSIKDISLAINPDGIEIFGNMVSPLETKINITALPAVKNGHLVLDIKTVKAGKVKLPKIVVGELNNLVEKQINDYVQRGSITYVDELKLGTEELTITGRMK